MARLFVSKLSFPQSISAPSSILIVSIPCRFWERGRTIATPEAAKHLEESFIDYLMSVVIEAKERDTGKYRSIDDYFDARRQNVGTRPSFVVCELFLSIPDEAFYHPKTRELETMVTDLIILDNVRLFACYIQQSILTHLSRRI